MSTDQEARAVVDQTTIVRAGTCAALLGSAAVHATVVSEHYAEWPFAGLFFLALQAVEVLLAIAVVMAWGRRVAALVALTSLGTLAVWALSRTVGMPIGPAALQERESVGVPDLACVVLEVTAALLVLGWARSARRQGGDGSSARTMSTVLGAAAVTLLAVAVTGWGLSPAVSGRPEQHHGDDAGRSSAQSNPLGHR